MSKLDFTHLLTTLIKQSPFSKKELAERAGISRSTLYNLINGDIADTKLTTLINLSSVLEVHPLFLLKPYFNASVADINLSQKVPGLGAGFVGDVSYPDYAIVYAQQTFTKSWLVMNTGTVPWEGLYLECQEEPKVVNGVEVGLLPTSRRIEIPYTLPGEKVQLDVEFTAPAMPCTVQSEWKAVNQEGERVLPGKHPLYCLVKVVGL